MIEITETGEVFYTNTRKERSAVGVVKVLEDRWEFAPYAGVHHKALVNVEALLRDHFAGPQPADVTAHILEEDIEEPAMEEIPEPPIDASAEPPQDPSMGDKTPAWMAWLKRTNPQKFAERFYGRTVPTID